MLFLGGHTNLFKKRRSTGGDTYRRDKFSHNASQLSAALRTISPHKKRFRKSASPIMNHERSKRKGSSILRLGGFAHSILGKSYLKRGYFPEAEINAKTALKMIEKYSDSELSVESTIDSWLILGHVCLHYGK